MLLDATAAAFVLAPRGFRPGLGAASSAVARRAVSRLVGGLPYLLRVGHREARERRPDVARSHGDGPLLRERSAADVDRLVGAAAPRTVSTRFTAGATLLVELLVVFGMFGPTPRAPRRRSRSSRSSSSASSRPRTIASSTISSSRPASSSSTTTCSAIPVAPRSGSLHPAKLRLRASAIWIALLFYASIAVFAFAGAPEPMSWLRAPADLLAPLRLANRYGLFARMTNVRYEIEFEGLDGRRHVRDVSLQVQAASARRCAGNLRAVPAALRVEPVVLRDRRRRRPDPGASSASRARRARGSSASRHACSSARRPCSRSSATTRSTARARATCARCSTATG